MTQENNQQLPFHLTEDYKKEIQQHRQYLQGHFASKPFKDLNLAKNTINTMGGVRFSQEQIERWLQSPASSQVQLRGLSNHLYAVNPLYRWWVSILAGMTTWSWVLSIDTYGRKLQRDKVEKQYRMASQYLNNKAMTHEFSKAWRNAIKEDWFYGYEVESENSYFIMKLNPDYCRASSLNEDGIYQFEFNFVFFESQTSVSDPMKGVIDSYPEEFKKKFNNYKRTGNNWQKLDDNKTICWKLNDDLDFGLPYFANMFPSLSDIGFYKDLEKGRAEIDNFLLLHQQIPVDEKELDKFAISLPIASDYDGLANSRLPDGVAMLTSPMKVTAVKTERSTNDKNNTKNAIEQAYTGAGIPQQLSSSTTAIGLGKAIMANEQIVYRFYRQVERTINYRLKKKYPSVKFKFRILDITHFNKDERSAELLKGAQSGIVPATHVASAYGTNPYELLNDVDFEKDVLNLNDKLSPLRTSYTMTGKETSGAPTQPEDKLSESGTVTRNNESNDKRE